MTTVVATNVVNYQVSIKGHGHTITSDEPQAVGGDDTGPTPFELLLSSLAACTAITVRMYAARKDWPLEKINLSLSHQKISADACDDCVTLNGKIDQIQIDISFEGDLTADQIERLEYIAGRCPVHRSLVSETKIRIN